MYCWGKAGDGALGLGGIEDMFVTTPTWNKHIGNRQLKSIACGLSHTLILVEEGVLYSCGNNEVGQLGQENGLTRPTHIDTLHSVIINQVQCGYNHSLALTSEGTLYSWGDNREGQLGIGNKDLVPIRIPTLVGLPNHRPVVQVVCGGQHTLALTQDGCVYSWGKNTHGQLGHSVGKSHVATPTVLSSLQSVPVARLAAGAGHSMAITVTGLVFAWGRNSHGQLGLGHTNDICLPNTVDSLDSCQVKFIACGDEHTAFLLNDGSVYTVGSNQYGQLGRQRQGSFYAIPGKMTSFVTQVACGRHHTMILTADTGQLYSFGKGSNGQLGSGSSCISVSPVEVCGQWLSPNKVEDYNYASLVDNGHIVKGIYAGGDQSFTTVFIPENIRWPVHPTDHRILSTKETPCFLSYDLVKQMLDVALITNNYNSTLQVLEMFFSSPSCINGSFLKTSSPNLIKDSHINHSELIQTFSLLRQRLTPHIIDTLVVKAFTHGLLPRLPEPPPCMESLRLFLVILSYPLLKEYPHSLQVIVTFVKIFLYIPETSKVIIEEWLFNGPEDVLLTWIEVFRVPICQIIKGGKKLIAGGNYIRTKDRNLVHLTDVQTWALQEGIKVLRWLYECNKKRLEPIPYQKFYVDEIMDCCDLREDYFCYKTGRVDRVLFTRYSFVLNVASKAELIRADGLWNMRNAVMEAHHQNLFYMFTHQGIADLSPLACILHIRRNYLIPDTISSLLSLHPRDVRKPLRVRFDGEEGVDEGGVQKEFFMLLIQAILNPDFGMFFEDEESRLIWFREQCVPLEPVDKQYFHVIGMICGLAIYNGVIVDLPFPVVLYKKLLGGTGLSAPNLDDLQVLKPSVGKHLRHMLQYEGDDFNEIYGEIKFELTRHFFGSLTTVPLIPNGSDISITQMNKHQYVDAYVEYELVKSIKEQYDAFAEGFNRVCNTKSDVIKLCHPEELMDLVTGLSTFDFREFQKHTEYINGYTADSSVIKRFWSVINDLPLEAKKKLLVFWTGSNRIPVGGVKSMKLRIQRMDGGPRCHRLPVAHTCANVLDLPPYPSTELMKQKILQAIHFTEGFGIV